ncbi:hypothetical protein IWQ61_010662, partial [Dispira simplex]
MEENLNCVLRMEEKLGQLRDQRQVIRAVIEEMELELYGIPLSVDHENQRQELQKLIDVKIKEGQLVNSYIQQLKERLAQHHLEEKKGRQVRQSVPPVQGRSEAPT